jgi:hypothetical protein
VSGDVRVVVDEAAVKALARDEHIRDYLLAASVHVVRAAQGAAPRLTGAGAESIHTEPVLDGDEWTARTSWDRVRYYMFFQERGTKKLDARPFLVPALE